MFGSPEHTAYDLRFRLLNIPVRVHPLFWLITAMIGGSQPFRFTLIWIACVFVSIIVHEFGHGLAARRLGGEPSEIVLYSMGGLCFSRLDRPTPLKEILVSAAGPAAGFALAALVLVALNARYGIHPFDALAFIGLGNGNVNEVYDRLPQTEIAQSFVLYLLWINCFWGIFNLFPIWPLDGGQIAMSFLRAVNPLNGVRWAHVVALLTAGAVSLWAISRQSYPTALFVGFIGYMNYQILQTMHDSYRSTRDSGWGR